MGRRLTLKNILTTRNKLKNARRPGNQTCSLKLGVWKLTKIPTMANAKTSIILVITSRQEKLESYQGVMVFLKEGP